MRDACRRHLDDLKRTDGIRLNLEAANHASGFFEEVLKLSEGQFEGQPFRLKPSQAFIFGSLFGMRATGEAGAQIYAAAAKHEQAGTLFADAVKMVRQSPALARRLEFPGGPGREFNIAHHGSGSFFRPVSRDTGKTGSGPRPYFVLADEIHELLDRSIIEMLERGFKFRREPLLFMITNSGSDRNLVASEEHEHAVKVAAGNIDGLTDRTYLGEIIDDTTFSYVCALDEGDDPLTDPSCWIKANPLLGVTITEEYLAEVVAQTRAIPGQLNGILRLHFCVWTDAETAWMTRATLEPLLADFEPKPTSSGMTSTMLGALTGAFCGAGNAGMESLYVLPIAPANDSGGRGRTTSLAGAATAGTTATHSPLQSRATRRPMRENLASVALFISFSDPIIIFFNAIFGTPRDARPTGARTPSVSTRAFVIALAWLKPHWQVIDSPHNARRFKPRFPISFDIGEASGQDT